MANGAISGSGQRSGSDQEGRLSGAYCRATDKFLRDNGVEPDDVDAVMEVLNRYAEAEAEDSAPGYRASVQWPGAQDAMRRALAMDALLPPAHRRYPDRPTSARQDAAYEARFPEAAKIRVL